MDDYTAIYAFLVVVMFIILLSRFDSRFGKIEKELDEIKKRMDDYLRAQQRAVGDEVKQGFVGGGREGYVCGDLGGRNFSKEGGS